MKKANFSILVLSLVWSVLSAATGWAQQGAASQPDIYAGYYSREGNDGKKAEESGNSHYVKFYPGDRIVRLFIPFPYSKSLQPDAILAAFDAAANKTSGSAYIRDTFGVMEQPVVAHIDSYRRVEGQIMYDCGKSKPCRVEFNADSMTEVKPGIVLDHNIPYTRVMNQ